MIDGLHFSIGGLFAALISSKELKKKKAEDIRRGGEGRGGEGKVGKEKGAGGKLFDDT